MSGAEGYSDMGAWTTPNQQSTTTSPAVTTDQAPGNCLVGTMELPVPERVKLVDHALSRVARKGLLAEIAVTGPENTDIFDPDPGGASTEGS